MTQEDAGHYKVKHPPGTTCSRDVAVALEQRAKNVRITCTLAHEAARSLELPPSEIGKGADLLELRIVECQLGLFGYSPEKRLVRPAAEVSEELRGRLEKSAADGRITCASCWEVAEDLGLEKMAVSAACELLGLKITRCQLGAF